jgi:hypothetical protein
LETNKIFSPEEMALQKFSNNQYPNRFPWEKYEYNNQIFFLGIIFIYFGLIFWIDTMRSVLFG